MSFTTIPQSTLPENRPTQLAAHPSGYIHHSPPSETRHSRNSRRPSPYPVLPRHLPTDFGPGAQYTGRHRREDQPVAPVEPLDPFRRPAPRSEAEYTAKLQEIAWARFLRKTADLAACHVRQPKPPLLTRLISAFKRVAAITRPNRASAKHLVAIR